MAKLIYPELSYKIVGVLFAVNNQLGCGLLEKHYQKAIKHLLTKENIPFLEQVKVNIDLFGESVGTYYLDFLIDNKIILELKASASFSRNDINQVLRYLRKTGIELGILARFGPDGVKTKRILKGYK